MLGNLPTSVQNESHNRKVGKHGPNEKIPNCYSNEE